MRELASGGAYQRLRVVQETHKGKGHALQAGFREAEGSIYALSDADLQHDPEQIVELVSLLRTGGFDLVNGRAYYFKRSGKDRVEPLTNLVNNWISSGILGLATGVRGIKDPASGLKVMRADVLPALPMALFSEPQRYFAHLLAMAKRSGRYPCPVEGRSPGGVREVSVNHGPRRKDGTYSKYGRAPFYVDHRTPRYLRAAVTIAAIRLRLSRGERWLRHPGARRLAQHGIPPGTSEARPRY